MSKKGGSSWRKQVAADTLSIVARGEYRVRRADGASKTIKLDPGSKRLRSRRACIIHSPPLVPAGHSVTQARVVVATGDSFDAALWCMRQAECRAPLVLDFASDSNPGGGYKGEQCGTQEESLCRRSNLACHLEMLPYPLTTLGAAYCPDIVVFRETDDRKYELLPEPFWVACAASALRCVDTGGDKLEQKQALFVRQKLEMILAIARHHKHDAVVLGAWGCGAFGNSAKQIAAEFKAALAPHLPHLKCVVFAIPAGPNRDAFQQVFHEAERVSLHHSSPAAAAN